MKILDRFLPLWIFVSAVVGLSLGIFFPQILAFWEALEYHNINFALALGLIIMLYPPLAKADYSRVFEAFENKKLLGISLVLNWLVGPVLMFALAFLCYVLFPPFSAEYMQGVILIGLARCIAMVLVWTDLALGDRNYVLGLVALNSLFQILFFSLYAYVFMVFLPSQLGISLQSYSISIASIAKNVGIYLGIPFVLGLLSRVLIVKAKGLGFYENTFLPTISPLSLVALLYVIIVMFSYKGESLIRLPFDTLLVSVPLIAYFVIMFFLSFYISKAFNYAKRVATSFSACGNNFELSLAIAIVSFGISSPQSFVSVVGVLIEVPVMIALASWLKYKRKSAPECYNGKNA